MTMVISLLQPYAAIVVEAQPIAAEGQPAAADCVVEQRPVMSGVSMGECHCGAGSTRFTRNMEYCVSVLERRTVMSGVSIGECHSGAGSTRFILSAASAHEMSA